MNIVTMDGSAPSSTSSPKEGSSQLHGEALQTRVDQLQQAQRKHFAAGHTLPQAVRADASGTNRARLGAYRVEDLAWCGSMMTWSVGSSAA